MARGQETHHAQVTEQLPARPNISRPQFKSAKSVPPGDLTQAMLPSRSISAQQAVQALRFTVLLISINESFFIYVFIFVF